VVLITLGTVFLRKESVRLFRICRKKTHGAKIKILCRRTIIMQMTHKHSSHARELAGKLIIAREKKAHPLHTALANRGNGNDLIESLQYGTFIADIGYGSTQFSDTSPIIWICSAGDRLCGRQHAGSYRDSRRGCLENDTGLSCCRRAIAKGISTTQQIDE
jgi:hypothetical protein